MIDSPPPFVCPIAIVVDADTVTCRNGQKIRLAGITALERNGRCNSAPDCAAMPYAQAKAVAQRIALHRTYRFRIYERSGKRLVGDAPELRCRLIASGAAVEWTRYVRKYRLGRCAL